MVIFSIRTTDSTQHTVCEQIYQIETVKECMRLYMDVYEICGFVSVLDVCFVLILCVCVCSRAVLCVLQCLFVIERLLGLRLRGI